MKRNEEERKWKLEKQRNRKQNMKEDEWRGTKKEDAETKKQRKRTRRQRNKGDKPFGIKIR